MAFSQMLDLLKKKEKDNIKEKYNHTSIAKCKIKLKNESILDIYGYDEVADYMYRYIKENDNIFFRRKN